MAAAEHQLLCAQAAVVAEAVAGHPDQSASLLQCLKVALVVAVATVDQATQKVAKVLLLKQQMPMLTSDLTCKTCNAELNAPGSLLVVRNHAKWS